MIGDGRSCALTYGEGGIDWLSWPRPDADPVFAALLDAERGGAFRARPRSATHGTSRYVEDTNISAPTSPPRRERFELLDLMTVSAERDGDGLAPEHESRCA